MNMDEFNEYPEWLDDDGFNNMDEKFNYGDLSPESVKFLNEDNIPTAEQIINALISNMDRDKGYEIHDGTSQEEEPHEIYTLKGSVWVVDKMVWEEYGGFRNISFNIRERSTNNELILDFEDDIPEFELVFDKEFKEFNLEIFNEALDGFVEVEDYDSAASLRDWYVEFTETTARLEPKIQECFAKNNYSNLGIYTQEIMDMIDIFYMEYKKK